MALAVKTANHEHPVVLGAGHDVDVAQTTIKVAESTLLPTVAVQASASRSAQSDSNSVRANSLVSLPLATGPVKKRQGALI